MSLSGCARDIAMGLTSSLGGWIVTRTPSGSLENFHWLGWIAVSAGIISVWLGSRVRANDGPAATTAPSLPPTPSTAPSLDPQVSVEN